MERKWNCPFTSPIFPCVAINGLGTRLAHCMVSEKPADVISKVLNSRMGAYFAASALTYNASSPAMMKQCV